MSFWTHLNKHINEKAIPALQKMDVNKNHIKNTYTHHVQGTFRRHSLPGSMTVEAALVFPMVFFVWAAFISLTSVVKVYESIQQSLADTALELAVEAGEDEDVVRIGGLARAWLRLQSLDGLETGGIQRISGYDFSGSDILNGNEWLILQVKYKVELLEGIIPIPGIPVKNYVIVRAWTGYDPENSFDGSGEAHTNVYVTEYGNVYHEDRMCSHIHLKIYMVGADEAKQYPPCERCVQNSVDTGSTYYVTESGECYHCRLGCSGLKRTVQRMTVEEAAAGGYGPCSRCSGGGE